MYRCWYMNSEKDQERNVPYCNSNYQKETVLFHLDHFNPCFKN